MLGYATIVYAYQQREMRRLLDAGCPRLLAFGLVMTRWSR